jgi:hypothetical protein
MLFPWEKNFIPPPSLSTMSFATKSSPREKSQKTPSNF